MTSGRRAGRGFGSVLKMDIFKRVESGECAAISQGFVDGVRMSVTLYFSPHGARFRIVLID